MKNDKKRAIILLVLLVAVIAAVVLILRSRPAAPVNTAYARTAWTAADREDRPVSVHYMQFSNPSALSGTAVMPSASAALVPISGYAYVFSPAADGSLDSLTLVFVNAEGETISELNYGSLMNLSDTLGGDAAYIEAATYVLNVYLTACDNGAAISGDIAAGSWYSLSDSQITDIIR